MGTLSLVHMNKFSIGNFYLLAWMNTYLEISDIRMIFSLFFSDQGFYKQKPTATLVKPIVAVYTPKSVDFHF